MRGRIWLALAVARSTPERPGGRGAVREVCDLIVQATETSGA